MAGYVAASLATFILYGLDKRAAARRQWRVPERALHMLALFGGFPGALLARRVFRHKTRKTGFTIMLWLIIVVHAAGWGAWLVLR